MLAAERLQRAARRLRGASLDNTALAKTADHRVSIARPPFPCYPPRPTLRCSRESMTPLASSLGLRALMSCARGERRRHTVPAAWRGGTARGQGGTARGRSKQKKAKRAATDLRRQNSAARITSHIKKLSTIAEVLEAHRIYGSDFNEIHLSVSWMSLGRMVKRTLAERRWLKSNKREKYF